MIRFFKWLSNTAVFKGFAVVTAVFGMVAVFFFIMISVHCLYINDYSFFDRLSVKICETWNKLLAFYLGASLLFSYFIAIER